MIFSLALASALLSAVARSAHAPSAQTVRAAEPDGSSRAVAYAAPLAARTLVARGQIPGLRWGRLRDFTDELRALYPDSADAPVGYWWVQDGRPTTAARAVIAALATLPTRGLAPADFELEWLARQYSLADRLPFATDDSIAAFDVTMSLATLRVSWALRRGSVRPRDLHPEFRVKRTPFDVAGTVRQISRTGAVDSIWTALEPDYLHYGLTKGALNRYRSLAGDPSWPSVPALPVGKNVTAGTRWNGVPVVRRMLVALGDLSADSVSVTETRHVEPLVNAIKRFQARHGIAADGEIGRSTRAALAVPMAARVRSIERSLERWRWLPRLDEQTGGAPLVLVNIPAFRLYAFTGPRDDERGMMSMNVVVGQAIEKETPIFTDTLSQIVFAPAWDVPASIANEEIWPKVRADPTYLDRNNYEIVQQRIRQKPGPWNALGKVKFLFPNDFAIYMHDTPTKRTFGRARRDASHGCIRLEDPRRFARWLLPDTTTWDDAWLDGAFARDSTLAIEVPKPRPVVLMYATAMGRPDGTIDFYTDIYKHDDKLTEKLAQGYPRAR